MAQPVHPTPARAPERRIVAAAKRRETDTMTQIGTARGRCSWPLGHAAGARAQHPSVSGASRLNDRGPDDCRCAHARAVSSASALRAQPQRARRLDHPAAIPRRRRTGLNRLERQTLDGRSRVEPGVGSLSATATAAPWPPAFCSAESSDSCAERVFGFYFGVTDEADAFRDAFRIPNLLQNLFGEGVLSASFIPVYASLIADDDHEEATRVAGAVFSILALVVSGFVLVGVIAAPVLVDLIAGWLPGHEARSHR